MDKVAEDYSKYCNVDLNNKFEPLNKSIDDMLARLEEFQTMLLFVQQEQNGATESLKSLSEHKESFNDLFDRIDKVESLVSHIKSNLNTLEEDIAKGEALLGCPESTIKVSNLLNPFFKKSSDSKEGAETLALFKTEDYFH